ncbi:MAG: fluoride efflux transporter CrcB, partial [Lactobacillus gasseri]|nr:fluoride efflux transporter CrcB [Lactobacillus gasseri]
PYATLLINLTGAFLLGLVFSRNFSPFVYALVGTGVLGGYTTFSTLNVELLSHWQDHNYKTFLLYALLSYGGGLILVFAGYKAGLII